MNEKIQFFSEETSFRLKRKKIAREWLIRAIKNEKKKPWYINFIFCSDDYLLELNRAYLKRNNYTDVISFPYSEDENIVSGDIYISVDRVRENAEKYSQSIEKELNRVMIHGLLHLMGYDDSNASAKKRMTTREDFYLRKLV